MHTHSTAEPATATADADAATRPLDLNKDTLRDLDAPRADERIKGGAVAERSRSCGSNTCI